jgi:hypothetical protein
MNRSVNSKTIQNVVEGGWREIRRLSLDKWHKHMLLFDLRKTRSNENDFWE